MRNLLVVVFVAVMSSACSKGMGSSTGPTPIDDPAPVPECQKNNTGSMSFRYLLFPGDSGQTYEISVEGTHLTSLNPGQVAGPFTVPVGTVNIQIESSSCRLAITTIVSACSVHEMFVTEGLVSSMGCH